MEAVYFAFGLLALALILGFFLKRSAPKDTTLSELAETVPVPAAEKVTAAQDDYSHIIALRESVAARQQQEREVGSVMLSSGVNADAHEHIREMVARLQSLSGTPQATSSTLENV